ncbi:P-loop containing nucleoside triphosphate hydrolase protein [Lipomyces arxii]|uniref:P-loop containing nucleoside triphosphate hydrolase protein n=1 Tax=Lipomyces arxii TaxID=56418 RepID=UPI0034CF2700
MMIDRPTTPTVLGKRPYNKLNQQSSPHEIPGVTTRSASRKLQNPSSLPTPPVTPTKPKVSPRKESVKKENKTPVRTKPRELGDIVVRSLNTPRSAVKSHSPATPTTPSTPSIYTGAKILFQRGSAPSDRLIGREDERKALKGFIEERVNGSKSGALYISGPPGTGKSALVSEMTNDVRMTFKEKAKVAYVNCMTLRRPNAVFASILHEFTSQETENAETLIDDPIDRLMVLFEAKKMKRSWIVVLDEMDVLITKDQEILYQIFAWTKLTDLSLIIIGIANALNLTTRFLPKMKARNFEPDLLRFTPYTADQIAKVITDRLEAYAVSPAGLMYGKEHSASLIHPAAIQLCSRKTAASTGDLRKAFDICKRGLDLAEEEARRKFSTDLSERTSSDSALCISSSITSTPSRGPARFEIPVGAIPPKVTISHVARICSVAFGGSAVQRIQSLNLQQKAVLCALLVGEKQKIRSLTIQELYEHYGSLCAKDKLLDSLKVTEFREVISALEVCGVISLSSLKGRLAGVSSDEKRRISSAVQEIDLLRAVGDVGLLKRFFADRN